MVAVYDATISTETESESLPSLMRVTAEEQIVGTVKKYHLRTIMMNKGNGEI